MSVTKGRGERAPEEGDKSYADRYQIPHETEEEGINDR